MALTVYGLGQFVLYIIVCTPEEESEESEESEEEESEEEEERFQHKLYRPLLRSRGLIMFHLEIYIKMHERIDLNYIPF